MKTLTELLEKFWRSGATYPNQLPKRPGTKLVEWNGRYFLYFDVNDQPLKCLPDLKGWPWLGGDK